MKPNLFEIHHIKNWKNGIGDQFLVRGIGKRAIIVVVRPAQHLRGYSDRNYIIKLAARYAAKKGWKTIYVEPDDCFGHCVQAFNTSQFLNDARLYGYFGQFLCMINAVDEETETDYNLFDDKEFLDDCRYS